MKFIIAVISIVIVAAFVLFMSHNKPMELKNPILSATPADCLALMNEAIEEHDEHKFLSCFTNGGKDMIEMHKALFEFSVSGELFRKDFIATYGEEAWVAFQENKHGASIAPLFHDIDGKFSIEGDKAYLRDRSDNRVTCTFIFRNNSWVFDPSEFKISSPKIKPKIFYRTAKCIDEARERISPDVTPEQIDNDLGMRFFEVMLGGD